MAKRFKMAKQNNFLDTLERWSRKHPFWFWGLSIGWIIFPDPIPIADDLIIAVILSIVGVRKLK